MKKAQGFGQLISPPQPELKVLTKDQIPALMKGTMAHRITDITMPFKKIVDEFVSQLEGEAIAPQLIPEFPFFVMGNATMCAILESLIIHLGKEKFDVVMTEVGFGAGVSFGGSLLAYLRTQNQLPKDIEALIAIWSPYDRAANWGRFELEEIEQDRLLIKLENNFLERRNLDEPHRYCAFIKGYVEGFLWEALKEYYRWFTEALMRPPFEPLEPVSIKELPAKGSCIFEVSLRREQLEPAFDSYIEGKQALRVNEFHAAGLALRTSLEIAFKMKVGLTRTDVAPFFKLIKSYKANVVLDHQEIFEQAAEVYDTISRTVAHKGGRIDGRQMSVLVSTVGEILHWLELSTIGKARVSLITNSVQISKKTT